MLYKINKNVYIIYKTCKMMHNHNTVFLAHHTRTNTRAYRRNVRGSEGQGRSWKHSNDLFTHPLHFQGSPHLIWYGSNGLWDVQVLQMLNAFHASDKVHLPLQMFIYYKGLQQSPKSQLWQLANFQQGTKEEHASKWVYGITDAHCVYVLQIV